MLRFVTRRLLAAIPLLIMVTMLVFALSELVPGDPAIAMLGETATPEAIEVVREDLGLDEPLPQRYLSWLGGAVNGDLGTSVASSTTVRSAVVDRLPVSASLIGLAFVVTVVVAVPSGMYAGGRAGTRGDHLLTRAAALGVAMPVFWIGALLILVFGNWLGWLPRTGYAPLSDGVWEWFQHLILPGLALSAAGIAEVHRQTRAGVMDAMESDYVRTARAFGAPHRTVVLKYASKNAMIPVVTVLGLQIARLVGLIVLVETLFGMPGVGALAVNSVLNRDLPMIQGIVLIVAIVMLIVNLLVDLSYGYFSPKVRMAGP